MLAPDFVYEVAPTFQERLSDVTVGCGDSASLTCRVCGRPRPLVTWQGPDQSVILSSTPGYSLSVSEDGIAALHVSHAVFML